MPALPRLCLLLSLSLTGAAPALAQGDAAGWELKQDDEGIEVYVRTVEGSRYKAFKAVAVVDAGLPSLAAILDHTEACPRWLHRCESGTLLEQMNDTERLFHQVTDLPFPARTRDAIFYARVDYLDGGRVLITLEARPDAYPATKHVRIMEAAGTYLLEPLDGGRTRITWEQQADPGGRLPAWIVNALLTDMPFKSMQALRELVQEPPYKDAHVVYDEAGNPRALAY